MRRPHRAQPTPPSRLSKEVVCACPLSHGRRSPRWKDLTTETDLVAIRTSAYARSMRRLAASDVAELLAFVSEMESLDDAHAFPPMLLAGLQRLIPADEVAYSELDPSAETSILQIWLADGVEAVVFGADEESLRTGELWGQLRPTHP